jgi:hypothetical protein
MGLWVEFRVRKRRAPYSGRFAAAVFVPFCSSLQTALLVAVVGGVAGEARVCGVYVVGNVHQLSVEALASLLFGVLVESMEVFV